MPDANPPAHQPYVPDHVTLPEFTWPAVLVGAVLGIVFGASSLYLVLKVGMTVSASIPVAVLSITLFRVFSRAFGVRQASILENNIVQTTGSAGESIAFGVGVTMPAVMILGFELEITRVLVVSVLGGLLGILMMIPLRRAFIVKQHGKLIYPEGTACADVLIVGETGGSTAKTVFIGFGIAFIYQFLGTGMRLWKDVASRPLDWFKGATPALEANPALLGVGYIIGTKIACIMVAGGILQAFVLVPMIRFFGEGLGQQSLSQPRQGPPLPRWTRTTIFTDLRALHRRRRRGDRRHYQSVPRDAADRLLDRRGFARHAQLDERRQRRGSSHRSRFAHEGRLVRLSGADSGHLGLSRHRPADQRRTVAGRDVQRLPPSR